MPLESATQSASQSASQSATGRQGALDLVQPLAPGGWVCGVDEAGRGPLAGPVVAAAVILDPARPIEGLRDSKALNSRQRAALAQRIRESAQGWAIAEASVEEIDRLNILQATLLAMRRAVLLLPERPARALVDGNRAPVLPCEVITLIRGDALEPCISAASILAKTERDAIMLRLHDRYPQYGFDVHKGYPTAEHRTALLRLGACEVHRRSFGPVRAALAAGCPGA